MDKSYIVYFVDDSHCHLTEGELAAMGKNMEQGANNFQWFKRGEDWLVIALDKIIKIELAKNTKAAVVKPVSPEELRKEQEDARIKSISSTDAILGKLKNDEVSES